MSTWPSGTMPERHGRIPSAVTGARKGILGVTSVNVFRDTQAGKNGGGGDKYPTVKRQNEMLVNSRPCVTNITILYRIISYSLE